MQIKATLIYNYTLIKPSKVKKTDHSKCWQTCEENGILIHCWQGSKMVQPLWKTGF